MPFIWQSNKRKGREKLRGIKSKATFSKFSVFVNQKKKLNGNVFFYLFSLAKTLTLIIANMDQLQIIIIEIIPCPDDPKRH